MAAGEISTGPRQLLTEQTQVNYTGGKKGNKGKTKIFNCKINISTGPRQLLTEQTQVNYTEKSGKIKKNKNFNWTAAAPYKADIGHLRPHTLVA